MHNYPGRPGLVALSDLLLRLWPYA
jgi:hypothetical protein